MIFKSYPLQLGISAVNIMLVGHCSSRIIASNKTRQGYARKCILKLAGYLFMGAAK